MSNKINLFESLGLNKIYWGEAYKIISININLSSKNDCIQVIDTFCLEKGLTPLGNDWNEIKFDDFRDLLLHALQFNLGFGTRLLSLEKAREYSDLFLEGINQKRCKAFTNWFNNLWKDGSLSSNSISNHTLDIALILIDSNKMFFIYLFFED